MKTALVFISILVVAGFAAAKGPSHAGASSTHASSASGGLGSSHAISGYTKSNGTNVAPSHATNPNSTKSDNWTTQGNVNPYTGKEGTKSPY